jgi:hypothetical protein
MLEQRTPAPIHRAQRRQIRRDDVELLAEVSPQRRRHHADGLQQPSAHAQETDLQRQPEHQPRLAALLDHAPFGGREVEERLDLEPAQLARQTLEPETGRVPVVHVLVPPAQGHNSGAQTANSKRLICLGNLRLPSRMPDRSYRHFWH